MVGAVVLEGGLGFPAQVDSMFVGREARDLCDFYWIRYKF